MRGHGRLLLGAALLSATTACELLLGELPGGDGGPSLTDCEALCEIEDGCDLRPYDDCVAASCDGDARLPSSSDDCMQNAETCADVAECTCDESCSKLDDCTGGDDPDCPDTCVTLIEQDIAGTFQENRCRIESACEDLALCGG